MEHCDHEYIDLDCLNCGGFLGQLCPGCFHLFDGGDHLADLATWCACDQPSAPQWCRWCLRLVPDDHICEDQDVQPGWAPEGGII